MRNSLLLILFTVLVGLIVGAGVAFWSINYDINGAAFKTNIQGWHSDPSIGSIVADDQARARVAKHGLLALSRQEAVYFSRYHDDQGERLQESCSYRLAGVDMPAKWWSITLYAHDDFLSQNTDQAHSISRSIHQQTEPWQATISAQPAQSQQWLSSRHAGQFSLTLRLYNPGLDVFANESQIKLPSVQRLNCRGSQ